MTGGTAHHNRRTPLVSSTWKARAVCARTGPEDAVWFPGVGKSSRPAKVLCFGCPVRRDCLEFALALEEKHGIWGGLSPDERRQLNKVGAA